MDEAVGAWEFALCLGYVAGLVSGYFAGAANVIRHFMRLPSKEFKLEFKATTRDPMEEDDKGAKL